MTTAIDYAAEAKGLATRAATAENGCTDDYITPSLVGANEVLAELRRMGMVTGGPHHHDASGGFKVWAYWPRPSELTQKQQDAYQELVESQSVPLHRCAGESCPGYRYKASDSCAKAQPNVGLPKQLREAAEFLREFTPNPTVYTGLLEQAARTIEQALTIVEDQGARLDDLDEKNEQLEELVKDDHLVLVMAYAEEFAKLHGNTTMADRAERLRNRVARFRQCRS